MDVLFAAQQKRFMWIYFDGGFVSIVQKKGEVLLQVRGRRKEDVEAFIEAAATLEAKPSIMLTMDADYRYRCWMNRVNVATAVTALIANIDYDNFKDRVREKSGIERAHLYSNIWRATLPLEQLEGNTKLLGVKKGRPRAKHL